MGPIEIAAVIFGPAGGLFAALKFGLNGVKSDIHDIKKYSSETRDEVRGLRRDMVDVRERVSSLETQTEFRR